MGYNDEPIVRVRRALDQADEQKKLASRARRLRMLVEHTDYHTSVERVEVKLSIFHRKEVRRPIEMEVLTKEEAVLLAEWLKSREDAAIAKAADLENNVVGALQTDG